MADEFVPTTEDARLVWIDSQTGGEYGYPDDGQQAMAEFDAWLAAHDAEIREQALAPIRAALAGHPVCDVRPDGGIPSCGWRRAVADVRRALDRDGGAS